MMKKKKNTRVSREFFSLLSRPQNIYSSQFVAIRRYTPPLGVNGSLFMVTISKKEVQTAVKRNLLKRRYRYICRKVYSAVAQPSVIQCIVKKGALSATHQQLLADAERALPFFIHKI